MANIDKTDFWRNGKLSGAVNLLYSDLLNVDVVKPPYSWWNRNSSFFLQTRLWYIAEQYVQEYMTRLHSDWWTDWWVTDIDIIYDTNCSEESWTIYMVISNGSWSKKLIVTWRIKDWCFVPWSLAEPNFGMNYDNCGCWDWKLFKTNSPKWDRVPITTNDWDTVVWIQVNKLEGWVYRGYFTTQWILNWTDSWTNSVKAWDYLVAIQSSNTDWSWFAWQTRMVTGYSDNWKYLVLDTPWNWFAVADENWNTYSEVRWWDVTVRVYRDEWQVMWVSNWNQLLVFTWDSDYIAYIPTWWCIISVAESNWRIFALYNNWYVRYSRVWWRDQFFFDDEMYAGNDKSSLYAYRDFVLAFGKRSISVWTPIEYNNTVYYTMYQQSWTMWLKSRYSYWEHDWNLIFVSNDNRLMALWVAATSWKYMLSFEDIWQEIIWGKLANMLDTDEAFIADYDNELRVLIQTKSNPTKEDSKNSQTHIYKFDNQFKIWTEDHLENILMKGFKWWIWYWVWWLYIRWLVTEWVDTYNIVQDWREWQAVDFRQNPTLLIVSSMVYKPNPVVAKVWAFLIENEQTWLSWNPDLFNLAKLNRLIVTLGYGKYSSNTKIKITSYREWIWEITEVDTLETNDWIKLISLSYMWEDLDEYPELKAKKQCLIDTIWESQSWYLPECTANDVKVTDLIKDIPRCEWSKRINFQDHNICIDSSIYELAPHKPLVIDWLWSTQHYSSQIKLEIISKSWDILNFGWFLAELFIAPIGDKWADWENSVELSSC